MKETIPDEFMADTSIDTMSGPNISSHYILWSAAAFFILALLWANFAVLDEVSTGEGKVIPSSQIQIIQNLEGGIVKKIIVREGQIVEKGEILMYIDDTRFSSNFKETQVRISTLKAKISRLSAEATGTELTFDAIFEAKHPNIVTSQRELYQSRRLELETRLTTLKSQKLQRTTELAELQSKRAKLQRSYALVKEELDLTKPLLKEGAVSKVEVLRLERQANDMKGDLEAAEISIPRLNAAVNEAQNKIKELITGFRTATRNELNKAKAELAPLKESKTALADRVKRTVVRSPVRGTVKQLYVSTIGGVIKPGMDLMEIVPLDDTLLIEAKIKPSDIGFIRPGQEAIVKITAYDFAIYGGLPAVVEHISADTSKNEKDESYYEIHVRTKKNLYDKNGKPLIIIPGMMATVDILTGEKTVLDYLLKPILKAKQSALRER